MNKLRTMKKDTKTKMSDSSYFFSECTIAMMPFIIFFKTHAHPFALGTIHAWARIVVKFQLISWLRKFIDDSST